MGKYERKATEQEALFKAWRKIRANGLVSKALETRIAVDQFDQTANRNIKRIQKRLRTGEFQFTPQTGVTKSKSSGGKRGIVMASVHNRVVERSLLDTLQEKSEFVRTVISQPTSVGGVPDRSVPHALKIIHEAFSSGTSHFVRSDISGFFDNIPRKDVLTRISDDIDDPKFMSILDAATTVTLANEDALGEDREAFPTDTQGVAQGSPLSPLFGNILLNKFDLQLNGRGIVCVRFIDDFLILGPSEKAVSKAFHSASAYLKNLGLDCHDPFQEDGDKDKASFGRSEDGFVFLGYDCRPGLFQPSQKARQSVRETVDDHIGHGRWAINKVRKEKNSFVTRQRYTQTLHVLDLVLRGWGEAFSYNNSPGTMLDLDKQIDGKIQNFRSWYSSKIKDLDWKDRRRTGGVCLISDITPKSFDDVPFKLDGKSRFVTTANTVTVSTDGSVITSGRRKGKDQGPGGWAFIMHESELEISGKEPSTTNNRMELTAVIEAIKHQDTGNSIVVRTDSQYVHDAYNKGTTIKSNRDLWEEYMAVTKDRKIKIVWVKGHNKDPHNERADKLAGDMAKKMKTELSSKAMKSGS